MSKQEPIAIFHFRMDFTNWPWLSCHCFDLFEVTHYCKFCRNVGERFYIEWLDQHNPREVINESEAGDE